MCFNVGMPGELPFPTPEPHKHPHDTSSPDSLPDRGIETLPDLEDEFNPDNYELAAKKTAQEITHLSTYLDQVGEETNDLTLEQMRNRVEIIRGEKLIPHYITRARVMSAETRALLRRNKIFDVDNMGVIERALAIKAATEAEAAEATITNQRTPPPPYPRRKAG